MSICGMTQDPDGRIAHLIKLCDDYLYDTCIFEDKDHSLRYRHKKTHEWVIANDYDRMMKLGVIGLTLSYNQAVYNDLMIIGLMSVLAHDDYFNSSLAKSLYSGINNGYAFRGWCVDVEYLKKVIGYEL
jgi:hypothetical protein